MTAEIFSDLPLLIQTKVTTASSSWQELVEWSPDNDEIAYIEALYIYIDDTSHNPHLELWSNGEHLIRDYVPVEGYIWLMFEQKLRFAGKRDKPAFYVRVKSDGSNTINAELTIVGIRKKIKKEDTKEAASETPLS